MQRRLTVREAGARNGEGADAARSVDAPGTGVRARTLPGGAIRALAWNTFLEAARDRVLYLLLFFGLFVFGASRLLDPLALGEGRRITLDLGFAALSAFGCLTTIFVGHQLIFREIERKTLFFLFSRPLRRAEFVLGKYLGLVLVLAASVVVMGTLLAAVLVVSRYSFGVAFGQALLLVFCEMAILAAVAVFFAAFTSPVLAGLFTLAAWVIGHGSGELAALLAQSPGGSIARIAEVVAWIVPRLDLYHDIVPVAAGTAYPPGMLLWGCAYGLLYAGAALIGATVVLSRRELSL